MDDSIATLSRPADDDHKVVSFYAKLIGMFATHGVKRQDWVRAIADPQLFERLASILRQTDDQVELLSPPHSAGVHRLLIRVFNWSLRDASPEELKDQGDLVYLYCISDELTSLLEPLDPRSRSIVILRFGLTDGHCEQLRVVGERFGISSSTVRSIEANAIAKLRHAEHQRRFKHDLATDNNGLDHRIEVLDLSKRSRNCLSKIGVWTVGDLTLWTRSRLENVTFLGPQGIDAIEAELAKYGLKLADAK